ncbi:MAG: hypothetical protein QXS54_06365 [Candidatus Methanomethylicaceae archaeon]
MLSYALDTKHKFIISDDFFEQVFEVLDGDPPGFLACYTFALSKPTPLDVEDVQDDFAWNADRCALNKNFYGFHSTIDEELLFSLLNFTFSFLYLELSGRKLGTGASGISIRIANQLPIVNPEHLNKFHQRTMIEAARQLRKRTILDLKKELCQSDRHTRDETLLSALDLPSSAVDDLYASLCQLAQARSNKARPTTCLHQKGDDRNPAVHNRRHCSSVAPPSC